MQQFHVIKIGHREITLEQIKSIEEVTSNFTGTVTAQRPTQLLGYKVNFRWCDLIPGADGDVYTLDHIEVDVFSGIEILNAWAAYRMADIFNAKMV